jgi:hypothetical protein
MNISHQTNFESLQVLFVSDTLPKQSYMQGMFPWQHHVLVFVLYLLYFMVFSRNQNICISPKVYVHFWKVSKALIIFQQEELYVDSRFNKFDQGNVPECNLSRIN